MALEKTDREILIRIDERLRIVEEKLESHIQEGRDFTLRYQQHQTEIELIKAQAAMAEAERSRIEADLAEAKERFWQRINDAQAEREKLRLETADQEGRITTMQNRWKMIGGAGATVIAALIIHAVILSWPA